MKELIIDWRQKSRASRAISLVSKDVSQIGIDGVEQTLAVLGKLTTREGLNPRRIIIGRASSGHYELVRGKLADAVKSPTEPITVPPEAKGELAELHRATLGKEIWNLQGGRTSGFSTAVTVFGFSAVVSLFTKSPPGETEALMAATVGSAIGSLLIDNRNRSNALVIRNKEREIERIREE